jgi:magnesium chelatase family protein
VSGPLLDRIDLHVDVPRLPAAELRGASRAESSAVVAVRVANSRERQLARQRKANALLAAAELSTVCRVDPAAGRLLERAIEQLALSARAYHRVLRVAMTIADLAGSDRVLSAHIAEAVTWRQLDRRSTGPTGGDDSAQSGH